MTTSIRGLRHGQPVEIHIEDEHISAIEPIDSAPDIRILPGLTDLQVNGYAGYDLNADDLDVGTVRDLAEALWRVGTTTFLATVITGDRAHISRALRTISCAVADDPDVAHSIPGIHLEGPYLSALDGARGVHELRYVRDPDVDELDEWITASGGLLRIITVAPERPGAMSFIRAAVARGLIVSIGHTSATPEDVHDAIDAGATMSTHLGNGIQAMLPRHPNAIWAQIASDALTAGVITDGHHLPADTVASIVRAKTPARCVLVSDSAALAGSPPGIYETPVGQCVEVCADGSLRLFGTEFQAGSGACALECLRWVSTNTPIDSASALAMATTNPNRMIGLTDRGAIEVGQIADVLLLNAAGELVGVYVRGMSIEL